jgi:hypothetical protein
MKKNIFLLIILIFIGIQFIRIDKSNPGSAPELDFNFQQNEYSVMNKLVEDACYDCHSNTTKYPWYSNISPFSWVVKHHVNEGREYLNFSTWTEYSKDERFDLLYESSKKISTKEMPPKGYMILHSKAKISTRDRYLLAEWFKEIAENIDE